MGVQGGYEAIKETGRDFSVIVGNKLICNGVSQVLQEKGLSMPDDISISSSTSSRSGEKYTAKITTLSIPSVEMGHPRTKFLIHLPEDPHFKPQEVNLSPEFTVGQSSGPCKEQSK